MIFQVRLVACLLASLLLCACGGGGDAESAPESAPAFTTASHAPSRPELLAAPMHAESHEPLSAAPVLDANAVMDWAERQYSQYFPVHVASQKFNGFDFRYYPATKNYLGVSGTQVYVMGPVSGGLQTSVGFLGQFRCRVYPSSCTGTQVVSDAGVSQTVALGSKATLDGNGSYIPSGATASYQWTLVSSPSGSAVSAPGAPSLSLEVTPDTPGTYVFELAMWIGSYTSRSQTSVTVTLDGLRLYQDTGYQGALSATLPYESSYTSYQAGAGNFTSNFRLIAGGHNYTIANLSATDAAGFTVPFFSGLSNGMVIAAGATVPFSLQAPSTGGQKADVTYSFSIAETGQTFRVHIFLTKP